MQTLRGEYADWVSQHCIISPYDGTVSFTQYWNENVFLQEGETVLTVLPYLHGKIIGKIALPKQGAGKVEIGDKVLVELANYPVLEYGMVSGKITAISDVPVDDYYYAEFRPDSTKLVTNYNEPIDFRQNLSGRAEIITNSRSMLERVVSPFKKAIEKQRQLQQ
jgi:HlyD family secretion protein